MVEYAIVLLLICIFLKWILFVVFAPLFYYENMRTKKRVGMKDTIKTFTPILKKNWLICAIARYINGYKRYMDFQIGLIPSHSIRNFLYKNVFGVQMGDKSIIYFGAEIRAHANLYIGKRSIIGDRAILDARNIIIIGNNVNLSSNVSIWTEQHDHRDPLFHCNSSPDFRVRIDDRAWIGPNSIILHGVHIGEGAVVATGAVVTKDVLPYCIVAGIPAKKIGERTKHLIYQLGDEPFPFY